MRRTYRTDRKGTRLANLTQKLGVVSQEETGIHPKAGYYLALFKKVAGERVFHSVHQPGEQPHLHHSFGHLLRGNADLVSVRVNANSDLQSNFVSAIVRQSSGPSLEADYILRFKISAPDKTATRWTDDPVQRIGEEIMRVGDPLVQSADWTVLPESIQEDGGERFFRNDLDGILHQLKPFAEQYGIELTSLRIKLTPVSDDTQPVAEIAQNTGDKNAVATNRRRSGGMHRMFYTAEPLGSPSADVEAIQDFEGSAEAEPSNFDRDQEAREPSTEPFDIDAEVPHASETPGTDITDDALFSKEIDSYPAAPAGPSLPAAALPAMAAPSLPVMASPALPPAPVVAATQAGATSFGTARAIAPGTAPAPALAKPASENVRFSCSYPATLSVGVWSTIVAYAYLSKAADLVKEDSAIRLKSGPFETGKAASKTSIARGAEIVAVLRVDGAVVNPPSASVRWLEDWHRYEFRIMVESASASSSDLTGSMAFYVGPIQIAEIGLEIKCIQASQDAAQNTGQDAAGETPHPMAWADSTSYQSIFISYSHSDTSIIDKLDAAYDALGLHLLRDSRILRSGENWNAALLHAIETADLFQLCWSQKASGSVYVEEEWRHALSLQKPSFIRPVYWEKPMPAPPAELSHLHFAYLNW